MCSNTAAAVKKLSCQSCRKRRRKCDLQDPCATCVKLGIECLPVNFDRRKFRANSNHLGALEEYIANLETTLMTIKTAPDNNVREKILNSISLDGYTPSDPSESAELSADLGFYKKPMPSSFQGSILAKDTTARRNSAYPSNSLSISQNKCLTRENDQEIQVSIKSCAALSRSPLILLAISLFFKWLYPSLYFFIYRETFLSAFFQANEVGSYYCSEELVYAIAALGAKLVGKSEELYSNSSKYYEISKDIVLKKVFQIEPGHRKNPDPPSSKLVLIQSLLCLAFYDIGRGENPSAWYLSGLAFRIVHEIGLHLNPNAFDDIQSEGSTSQFDIEVRARIYWGCYLVDHFIAELFGRSTILRLSNSTVPETDELPNLNAGLGDYMYSDPDRPLLAATPVKKLIFLSRMCQFYVRKIFILSKTASEKIEMLRIFNREMQNWKSDLPKEFSWTRETLDIKRDCDPTRLYVWYHYYMILLSYNKAFIFDFDESRQLIEESVEDLYFLLRNWKCKFQTFEKCCIQMVHTVVLALQCIKTQRINNTYYSHFVSFLRSPTLNYELSQDVLEDEGPTEALYTFNLSDGANFWADANSDLSLLNEIDAIIDKQLWN